MLFRGSFWVWAQCMKTHPLFYRAPLLYTCPQNTIFLRQCHSLHSEKNSEIFVLYLQKRSAFCETFLLAELQMLVHIIEANHAKQE